MAHILARKIGSKPVRYTAIVRIRKGGTVLHRESKTFTLRSAAEKWARQREVELENPQQLLLARQSGTTLRERVRWYIDTFETISKWQRSKQAHLANVSGDPRLSSCSVWTNSFSGAIVGTFRNLVVF